MMRSNPIRYPFYLQVTKQTVLFYNIEGISPFVGSLVPLFWTSGFKARVYPLSPAHEEFLRIISCATPANLFAASMSAGPL